MSNYETLVYEESGDRVQLTLHRPPGNRINIQMIQELTAVCNTLEDHSKAKTVVIRGAGGVFSEGVDFSEFHPDKPMDIHGFNKWEKICTRLERLPKATIALVDGVAVGGGFQLALVCDLRIATSRASFQLPEVHMGFLPGMATFRMAKYVGLGHAKRMMVTCEKVGHEKALELGIIDRIDDDLEAGLAWAMEALGPNHSVAIELTRRLLNECYAATAENAIGHFLAAQHRAITQTAFLETVRREQDKS